MASSIVTLARIAFGPAPEVVCAKKIWEAGVLELRRRSGGRRESGAFLLGSKGPTRKIEEFVFYDDIDPGALSTGMVVIDGRALGGLWSHCRATGREVVADVHVHPGSYQQSDSDRSNPIMAELGHIAIILPHYARQATTPGGIGVYQYLGSRRWRDRSREAPSPIHVGWWPTWR
jgi:proteasome lid subunit RPN8/RPN11